MLTKPRQLFAVSAGALGFASLSTPTAIKLRGRWKTSDSAVEGSALDTMRQAHRNEVKAQKDQCRKRGFMEQVNGYLDEIEAGFKATEITYREKYKAVKPAHTTLNLDISARHRKATHVRNFNARNLAIYIIASPLQEHLHGQLLSSFRWKHVDFRRFYKHAAFYEFTRHNKSARVEVPQIPR